MWSRSSHRCWTCCCHSGHVCLQKNEQCAFKMIFTTSYYSNWVFENTRMIVGYGVQKTSYINDIPQILQKGYLDFLLHSQKYWQELKTTELPNYLHVILNTCTHGRQNRAGNMTWRAPRGWKSQCQRQL